MKRDKIISIRVNSQLFDLFKKTVDKYTTVYGTLGHRTYFCPFGNQLACSNKYSIADLLEESIKDFLEVYK